MKLFRFAAVCACALVLSGCLYKGAKFTEGTDVAIGINVPVTEGSLNLQVLSYVSGFRWAVADNSQFSLKATIEEECSYFGCVTTKKKVTADGDLIPLADPQKADADVQVEQMEKKTDEPVQ